MIDKDLKDWTFDELATYCTWKVMEHIIRGELKYGVQLVMDMTMRWKAAKDGK
jgi:hypothetical protein